MSAPTCCLRGIVGQTTQLRIHRIGQTWGRFLAVFKGPADQVACHAGEQRRVMTVGQDVDELAVRHGREIAASLRFSQ